MTCNRDVSLSKSLSWLLRHGAVKEGLGISPEGYIEVHQILHHKSFRGKYTQSDIERVVAKNDKKRFKLRVNSNTHVLEIKANQGHSLIVSEDELTPILQPIYHTVLHGTYIKCWPQIKLHGLHCMSRQHIHLAKGTLGDTTVISGLRNSAQVHIYIDLAKALADGIKFFESDNGVILTAGNKEGYLAPKYFTKAIKVSTGEQLYP